MKIRGIIRTTMPVREGVSQRTGNAWKSQAFIVDYFDADNQRSADSILCETFNTGIIEKLRPGAKVAIVIGHRVREYNERYYNDVQTYSINFLDEKPADTVTTKVVQHAAPPAGASPVAPDEHVEADDLPF